MPRDGIQSTRSANWKSGRRRRRSASRAGSRARARRPRPRRRQAFAAVGRRLREQEQQSARRRSGGRSGRSAGGSTAMRRRISERPDTTSIRATSAEEEGQRVVADVARLEESQQVARRARRENAAGVQDAVDDEDVDDLPQELAPGPRTDGRRARRRARPRGTCPARGRRRPGTRAAIRAGMPAARLGRTTSSREGLRRAATRRSRRSMRSHSVP